MPRGLYGRAALILIVPVVTVQIVVSLAFLQRYFEDVTQQLTRGLALDLRFLMDELEEDGIEGASEVAVPLAITIQEGAPPGWTETQSDRRLWYDLTGRQVVSTLREMVPEVTWIDLAENDRRVRIGLNQTFGTDVSLEFNRSRVSANNPHQLFVIMGFTGILMTAVAYLFLRNQLRPIRRLSRAAEAFGKGRVVPYKPSGALEVRAAGGAFLDMRGRIERQIEQRTLMLSGVSHDLRTPLTRLKLGLSLLESSEDQEGLLRDVSEMEDLLDTFLDFSRSDALDDPELTDVVLLATNVVEDLNRGGGNVIGVMPEDSLEIALRPVAVRRALTNLLSNALRYGSKARLSLTIMDRAVRYSVEDDGPGIAIEDRDQAMRPFARLDEARNQNKGGGVGLGLAIANDIARGHGGTLRLADSRDLGGLRVDLVLPR